MFRSSSQGKLPFHVDKSHVSVDITEKIENIYMKFYVDDWDKERVQFNWGKTSSIVNTMNVVLDIWVNDGIFDPILGIKVTNATMLVIKPYSGR